MSNEFVKVLSDRIEVAKAKDASATNMKKLFALRSMLANETLADLLRKSNIDAERFNRAIYASEKVIKFAHHAVEKVIDSASVNENAFAAFKTAMQLHAASLDMTKNDAECAISKDVALRDENKKALVYRRSVILSADTLNAQSQQVIDMLKTLNMLHSDNARATSYKIKRNALADALCEKFNIA